MLSSMRAIGYVRVSTDKQADHGVSLEAQEAKVRAMAVVQGAEIVELIVDGGESAKNLNRPGMERLLALVDERTVDTIIIAKLDRLTRSVKDLAELLERFQRRGVSLVSVAESLDTGSAAGRLVINIMTAVSQWELEAIGERTRDAMQHKRAKGQRVVNLASDEAFAFAITIQDCYANLDQIRVYVLTDRQAKAKNFKPREVSGKTVKLEVMDIERLHRHWSEGKPRDELVVNFEEVSGGALPCVYVPGDAADYDYAR